MNPDKKTTVMIGVLFLSAMFSAMIGNGLITSIVGVPDCLENVNRNKSLVVLGMVLEMVCAIAVVWLAVLLMQVVKKHNKNVAFGYLGFRIIESAIIFVGLVSILLLISLSGEYIQTGAPAGASFETLAKLAVAGHYWGFQMVIIVCGVAGVMLCYALYCANLIPRFLSVLDLIGYPLSISPPLLEMLGFGQVLILYLPGSAFEIILPIWLFVKGFNISEVGSGAGRQQ